MQEYYQVRISIPIEHDELINKIKSMNLSMRREWLLNALLSYSGAEQDFIIEEKRKDDMNSISLDSLSKRVKVCETKLVRLGVIETWMEKIQRDIDMGIAAGFISPSTSMSSDISEVSLEETEKEEKSVKSPETEKIPEADSSSGNLSEDILYDDSSADDSALNEMISFIKNLS